MRNQPDKIVYDLSQSQGVSFLLDYANSCSHSTFIKSEVALQNDRTEYLVKYYKFNWKDHQ